MKKISLTIEVVLLMTKTITGIILILLVVIITAACSLVCSPLLLYSGTKEILNR